MLIETGRVNAPPLPSGLRTDVPDFEKAAKVWDGFKLNWQCHQLYDPEMLVPQVWHFTGHWCRMGPKQAQDGLQWLVGRRWLDAVDTSAWTKCNYMYHFGPDAFAS